MTDHDTAALRARLNEELGFYPASLDPESIAEYRRKAAEDDGLIPRRAETTEHREIEARKKKAERGWIVQPPQPNPGISPVEEIERWCAVIGVRGRAS